MRIALYQPDIAANTGTILRLGACLGVAVDIIEPCGFSFSDHALRRAGMDYLALTQMVRHASWPAFLSVRTGRLILLTTRSHSRYAGFRFAADDTLLLGRESAGVPIEVHDAVDGRVSIPMRPEARSLNVAVAAAIVVGEALRQTMPEWSLSP